MVPPSSAVPETGRWSRSRDGWVPRRDEDVDADPDFAVRRFDDTGEMRWPRPGEGRIVDQNVDVDPVDRGSAAGWHATDTGTWSMTARVRSDGGQRTRRSRREAPDPPPYGYDDYEPDEGRGPDRYRDRDRGPDRDRADPYITGSYRTADRATDRYGEDVREVDESDRYDDRYDRAAPADIYGDPGTGGIYGDAGANSIYDSDLDETGIYGGDSRSGGIYDERYAEPEATPRRGDLGSVPRSSPRSSPRSRDAYAPGRRDRAPGRSVAVGAWSTDEESGSTFVGSLTSMLSWYAVPVLGYLVYALFLSDGNPQPGCVEQLGVTCVAPRAEALGNFAGGLPLLGLAFVLSLMLVVILRWFTKAWRSLTIGFVASVVGSGVATLFFSVLNSA